MGLPHGNDFCIPTYLDVDNERGVPPPTDDIRSPYSMAHQYVGVFGDVITPTP